MAETGHNQSATNPAPYDTGQFAKVVAAVRALEHPRQIGPYTIERLIGEGGMGSVYQAVQTAPIRRTVAIKIIKLGMDTRQVIARFESERQALAVMNHPNLAKVLDAGATETGRPYFVMEYVAGEPITVFADRKRLTIGQRLELFLQACDAIQHAHQKAIIHRDIKPSNILVSEEDGTMRVKVIDFGVAKAIDQDAAQRTLFTETGQFVGTPEYMSPEQARAGTTADVDTRSDVYSLGVVLYELLSGTLPFDGKTLRSGGYHEIGRIIREVDPPRPSTRLSRLGQAAGEVARLRQSTLDALARQLRGELEWIPLKAMRKPPEDRYSSASDLAQDVMNYLARRPLRAGPESRGYRARKFLARNQHAVAACAIMLLLLIGGVIATTWQAIRATRAERIALTQKREAETQRARAEAAAESLTQVNRFLTEDLIAAAAPEVTLGRELTVREALDRAADTVAARFVGRPQIEAVVRGAVAQTYFSLGVLDRALLHAQVARELELLAHGPDHPGSLAAARRIAEILVDQRKPNEAEPLAREAYERAERLFGPNADLTLQCLETLARSIRRQRRFAEAEPLYRTLVERGRAVYGPQSEEAADLLHSVAILMSEMGNEQEAVRLLREVLHAEARLPADHPSLLTSKANLAKALQNIGQLEEAEQLSREALEGRRRVLKDDHRSTLFTMSDLGWILAEREKFDEAIALSREALDRRARLLGPDDPDTLQSMNVLARVLAMAGHYDEAEKLFLATIEKRKRVLGERHAFTLGTTTHLAAMYESTGRFGDAEPLLRHVCQPENLAALSAQQRATCVMRLGICLVRLGRATDAEPPLLEALKLARAAELGSETQRVLASLVEVYEAAGNPAEAERHRRELATFAPASQPSP